MTISLPIPGSVVISTYDELTDALSRYLNRSDLSSEIQGFVANCESAMNRRLAQNPVLPMHVVDEIELASEYVVLPLRLLKVDEIDIPGYWPVLPTAPQNIAALKTEALPHDAPRYYAQIGDKVRLYPAPESSVTANIIYFERIPQLTEESQTNWVIRDHGDAYLFGCLFYSHFFEDDPQKREFCLGAFDTVMNEILTAYPVQTDRRPLRSEVGMLTRTCLA